MEYFFMKLLVHSRFIHGTGGGGRGKKKGQRVKEADNFSQRLAGMPHSA